MSFQRTLFAAIALFCLSGTGEAQPRRLSPELRKALLKKFDKDGDGKLSESERQTIQKQFDKDGNGRLSLQERAAAAKELGVRFRGDPNAPEPERLTWTINNEERVAIVYLPRKKTESAPPLVFGFHGHGGNMRNSARSFHFQDVWPEAVVVYMQGLPTPGRLTDPDGKRNGWQHSQGEKNDRDLKFFDAVLKTLKEKYQIDENRVYATGHSNGGGFTYLLWCYRPDVFAAIAPSAAGARSLRTTKPKPVPVLHLSGRKDPLVKFEWQELTMQKVRQINQCEAEGKKWAENATLYPSITGAPVVTYIEDEGTHKYSPKGPELIVKFFKEHARSPARFSGE